MKLEDIRKARELYGPFRKFPFYFMDHPEVNQLLDILPEALDEVERLQRDSGYAAVDFKRLHNENEKLRAVAGAAGRFYERYIGEGEAASYLEVMAALKAWRGE